LFSIEFFLARHTTYRFYWLNQLATGTIFRKRYACGGLYAADFKIVFVKVGFTIRYIAKINGGFQPVYGGRHVYFTLSSRDPWELLKIGIGWDWPGSAGTQSRVLAFGTFGSRVPGFDVISITDLIYFSPLAMNDRERI